MVPISEVFLTCFNLGTKKSITKKHLTPRIRMRGQTRPRTTCGTFSKRMMSSRPRLRCTVNFRASPKTYLNPCQCHSTAQQIWRSGFEWRVQQDWNGGVPCIFRFDSNSEGSMFTSEQLAKLHPTPTNKNFLTADDIFGVIEVKLAERDEIRRNQSSWWEIISLSRLNSFWN